ncbi:MAG: hypothetical protein KAG28_01755 [Cocleimonas sp.]|nr:hypothetical protein [Cocleimonas sp.]
MYPKTLSSLIKTPPFRFVFFSFILCFATASTATETPDGTLRLFYKLISKNQCAAALRLRPDYSLSRCEKITKTYIHTLKTERSDHNHAVLLLELDAFVGEQKNYFYGYVKLSKKNKQWEITGPFKNKDDYWLDEYINAYVPEGIKGLATIEKEKNNQPPLIQIVSEEPIKRLPDEETSQKQPIMPDIKKKSQPIIKKIIQPTAPGNSIDADEFKDQPKKTESDIIPTRAIQEPKSNPIKIFNTEAKKFLLGQYAIQGNYTSLLKKIRKNLATEAKANILLIDKSSNTLYLYNKTNSLLAVFPILSSDNSNFPSGLYRITIHKPTESDADLTQQINQPILLLKIEVESKRDHNKTKTINNKTHYYIRDLFDVDKTRSLQLSPIDNRKLQQLLSTSAIAYTGE